MFNIIVGIVFVIGGLTGRMTLLFTSSSTALTVFGVGLIVWGVYQEYQKRTMA